MNEYQSKYYSQLDPEKAANAINSKNQFDKDYYDAKSGETIGKAENTIATEAGAAAKFQSEMNRCMRSIIHKLNGDAAKGDKLAQSLLFAFTMMKIQSDAGVGSLVANVGAKLF